MQSDEFITEPRTSSSSTRTECVVTVRPRTVLVVGIGALIVPTLVQQAQDLIEATPGYVRDLTHGRGPLGLLETKYHVVERLDVVRDPVPARAGNARAAGR